MVLIYASGLVKYFGSGPSWYSLDSNIEMCKENWWNALLYVQNYLDYKEIVSFQISKFGLRWKLACVRFCFIMKINLMYISKFISFAVCYPVLVSFCRFSAISHHSISVDSFKKMLEIRDAYFIHNCSYWNGYTFHNWIHQ